MKLLFTSIFLLIGLGIFAQFDLEIAITDPLDGAEFESGSDIVVDVEITNWGDIIPEFDTLYLGWVLDGVFYGPNTGAITGASIGDGGVSFPVNDAANFAGLPDGEHTLCAWMIGIGSVASGQNFDLSAVSHLSPVGAVTIAGVATDDPTPENNEFCISFIIGDTAVVVDDSTETGVGIQESLVDNFSFYPNPAQDEIFINVPESGAILAIYQLDGKQIESKIMMNAEKISLDKIVSGVYLFQLTDLAGKILQQERVVVAH